MDDQKDNSRRSFLTKLWFALGFVALVEFIAVAFAFLRPDKAKARRERFDAIVRGGALDQSQDAHAIYRRSITMGGIILFKPLAGFRRIKVLLGWHGYHMAGDVLGNARNFIRKPCYILFVDICLLTSSALKFLLFFGFYG